MWKSAPIARWRMSSKWPVPKPNSSLTVRSPSLGNSALISATSLSFVKVSVLPVATLIRKRAQLSMCALVVFGASLSELAIPWKNCRSPKWLRAVSVSNLPSLP